MSRRLAARSKVVVPIAALTFALGFLVACGPMMRGQSSPAPPPSGRGGDCAASRSSCQAGLTCVSFHQEGAMGSDGATCEIPCGEGGACAPGMSCGDRGDRFWGAKARNVCLGEPTPAPPAPGPPPEATPTPDVGGSADAGIPVDADMSGTWQKVP